jgi:serine/threonine protein kinase
MACLNCGFELVEEGRSCAVCGADSIAETTQSETLARDLVAATEVQTSRPWRTSMAAGDVFASRYEIVDALGRGGMGAVYRAFDRKDGVERALKVLHATADDEHAIVRFRREIEILKRIRHPNVVQIFDYGVDEGRMYFTAELIEGENLRIVLRQRGVFGAQEVAQIGVTLAEALAVAHAEGVVHRDMKPHNVMLGPDGKITLLDFGVARGAGIDMNTITATGVMVGTPEYMSPEQFQGIRVDARSDIYALGVVLYELLAGALPFRGDTPVALGIRHQTELPPPIRPQRPNVPAWLERIIMKCLAKQPSNRYASASELAADLAKPHTGERRVRVLDTGDQLVEDDSGSEPWALTLVTSDERKQWTRDMALLFEDRYYRLEDIAFGRAGAGKWTYYFSHWPDEQILRKIVDYAAEAEGRKSRGIRDRVKGWFSSSS